mgnify:CR=1 FL=1
MAFAPGPYHMAKKIIIFGLIFALTLALYFPVFKVYFTGDDFFHFKIAGNLFGLHPVSQGGYAFYRPIFRELLYSISYKLWGLNVLPLRIFAFVLHFANVVLVFILTKRMFKNLPAQAGEKIAYLTAFFFSVSAANASVIYYLAGGLQAQGAAFFVFLSLLLFPKHKLFAFLTFVLSLMSHEIAVITPMLIAGVMFLNKDFKIKYLLPYLLVLGVYLYIDFGVIGFSRSEVQYMPSLNIKTLFNSLFWYGLWSFGLPETMVDLIGPGLKVNPDLMKNWGDTYRFVLPGFGLSIASLLILIIGKIKSTGFKKEIAFLAFWFVVGISTVLLLPSHKSTYYLVLSLPAFWGIISYFIFDKSKLNKILSVVFMVGFLIMTYFSVRNMNQTYWAAQRGRLSQKIVNDFKSQYPTLPKGATVYMKNDPSYPFISEGWGGTSKQASLILSGSVALELLYKDPTLKVYYQDLDPIPEGEAYEFVVKL